MTEQTEEKTPETMEDRWESFKLYDLALPIGAITPTANKQIIGFLVEEIRKAGETMDKLHAIENAKCIYDIHYCKAGIGIIFYDAKKDTGEWRNALTVERYYPTFEECIEAEFASLNQTKE